MSAESFTFYTDPGHGWLQVSPRDLEDLGLKNTDFSSCSYWSRAGQCFFLEEDCDAPKFLALYKAKHTERPIIREVNTNSDSFIRRLARIK